MGDIINIESVELAGDEADPPGYRGSAARLHPLIGGERLHANLFELPPGESVCPYHYELTDEEWLLVLSGTPTLRRPAGEDVLAPGDLVCFPVGPDGAHKVSNAGPGTARVLMLSTNNLPAVCVYPDSDKLGVFHDDPAVRLLVRRSSGVPYFEGEA